MNTSDYFLRGLAWQGLNTVYRYLSAPFRWAANAALDTYKIVRYKDQFILGELTDRAFNSEKGIARASIGLPSLGAGYHFMVVTGSKYLAKAADYGNVSQSQPERHDPQARRLFKPFRDLFQADNLVFNNDQTVRDERALVSRQLNHDRLYGVAWEVMHKALQQWSSEKSMNDQISLISIRMIAQSFMGLDDIPDDLLPLIQEAEHCVLHRDEVSAERFGNIRDKLKSKSDDIIDDHAQKLRQVDNIIRAFSQFHGKDPKETNPGASLITYKNLFMIMLGACLILKEKPSLKARLISELEGLGHDHQDPKNIDAIQSLPFLECFYKECLRYFAPNPPLVRYASKNNRLGDEVVHKNTMIFVPLRRVLHSEHYYQNPHEFNPDRFEGLSSARTSRHPMVAFSLGQRMCLASKQFVEGAFKIFIAAIYKEHDLAIQQSLEDIPSTAKIPEFETAYHGQLVVRSLSQRSDLTPHFRREVVKRVEPDIEALDRKSPDRTSLRIS